ncbi:hypothetical protein OHB00_03225 [Streptomyces sp. NBC_00631]|uniref:hypothetical protein n=1 Tax=Streptomyces sp. NBC_00631 TaxID=2975793 RepID=UPI0030E0A775
MTFGFDVWGEETAGRPRQLAASGRCTVVHVPQRADRASAPWSAESITAFT